MTEYGRCECGCGGQTNLIKQTDRGKGYAKGEPYRFLRGHHSRKAPIDFIESAETNCWIWQLGFNGQGYGGTQRDGRTLRAHRVFYEDLVGPIPDGLVLHHICRTTLCVNPGHLEPITNRENVLLGDGVTAAHARKTHCRHGHEFTPENTYIRPQGGRTCRICIRKWDVERRATLAQRERWGRSA